MTEKENPVLDRIRKLLRLAESTNVHEAALAAKTAQALMERHRIERASLDTNPDEDEPIARGSALISSDSRIPSWKVYLAAALAKANSAAIIISSTRQGREIQLVGRESDLQVVAYMFGALSREIDTLCRREGRGRGRSWAHSFRHGAVEEVRLRLSEGRQSVRADVASSSEGSRALARVDARAREVEDWIRENVRTSGTYRSSGARSSDGYSHGRAAGRSLDLQNGEHGRLAQAPRQLGSGRGR
jgi:hypothetical protein